MNGNQILIFLLFGLGWVAFFNFWFLIFKKQRARIKEGLPPSKYFTYYKNISSAVFFILSVYSFNKIFLSDIMGEVINSENPLILGVALFVGCFVPMVVVGFIAPMAYEFYAHGIAGLIIYFLCVIILVSFITDNGNFDLKNVTDQAMAIYYWFLAGIFPFEIGNKMGIVRKMIISNWK